MNLFCRIGEHDWVLRSYGEVSGSIRWACTRCGLRKVHIYDLRITLIVDPNDPVEKELSQAVWELLVAKKLSEAEHTGTESTAESVSAAEDRVANARRRLRFAEAAQLEQFAEKVDG